MQGWKNLDADWMQHALAAGMTRLFTGPLFPWIKGFGLEAGSGI